MASGHADRDRVVLVCGRPPRRPSATFATIQRRIFARSCATLSCHGAAAAGGLGLAPDSAYADLVGVAPNNVVARAAGLLRVTPGDPGRSFLLRKVEGAVAAGEGERMPQVGPSLSARSIDLLRRWILAGAPATAPF
jgi:mono/diheme cytochrome c family protein